MSAPLREALHDHAAQLLHTAGIDEPLTWTPSADCVAGLTLPGRDPDDIDIDAVRNLVTVEQLGLSAAARRLGVSTDHIRHALPRLHRPPAELVRNSTTAGRRLRERAASLLTRQFFRREYVNAGKTLTAIEAETGIHRRLLAHRARHLGIRLLNEQPIRPIDTDWLREQAETCRRTKGDIGAELGVTGETIRRYRKKLGITAGPTGMHRDQRQYHPDLPDDIRRAVDGQRHGWQRLRRFQQMMAYPSMNTAAAALGLHTQNLNLQVQRLETDIGAALLRRGHRYQPMRPTEHGHRLLEHLDQPAVRHLLDHHAKQPLDTTRISPRFTAEPVRRPRFTGRPRSPRDMTERL